MSEIDHLLWGAPDLQGAVRLLFERTGIEARPGGAHLGLGTRNALVGLGDVYLELIAPDPEQDVSAGLGRELAGLTAPRLQGFAVRCSDLERLADRLRAVGVEVTLLDMSRGHPDGRSLRWRVALVHGHAFGRVVPFAIDWGQTPNPASELTAEAALEALELVHPERGGVQRVLDAMELDLTVGVGREPRLSVRLDTPKGLVGLDS